MNNEQQNRPLLNTGTRWRTIRLKYAASQTTLKSSDPGVRYVGLENIESFTGRLIETDSPPSDGDAVVFSKEDVLFGKLRPYLAKAYLPNEGGRCTGEFLVLRPKSLMRIPILLFAEFELYQRHRLIHIRLQDAQGELGLCRESSHTAATPK